MEQAPALPPTGRAVTASTGSLTSPTTPIPAPTAPGPSPGGRDVRVERRS